MAVVDDDRRLPDRVVDRAGVVAGSESDPGRVEALFRVVEESLPAREGRADDGERAGCPPGQHGLERLAVVVGERKFVGRRRDVGRRGVGHRPRLRFMWAGFGGGVNIARGKDLLQSVDGTVARRTSTAGSERGGRPGDSM
ncbi:hypothetical protein ACFQJD_18905 [Haloplanus sp. GCM10025708]|uniref:hypothetical protein n=1 Tax=Haloplanus sp. GCM10025708 TaxID=3252679 RepID=UPI003616D37E